MKHWSKFLRSKYFSIALWSLGMGVLTLAAFKAGVTVGYRKAKFSFQWGESYHRNFAGPRTGFFRDYRDRDFIAAHGTIGRILTLDRPTGTDRVTTAILQGRDGVEKVILADAATTIRRGRGIVPIAGLRPDDMIVVIGDPNDEGQIKAKFIRVMPPPRDRLPPMDFRYKPRW